MNTPKRKARRCGYCNQTGHTIRTCETHKEVAARKRRSPTTATAPRVDETHFECPTCGNAVPQGQSCHHNLTG